VVQLVDIAHRAGVSVSIASRVLNADPKLRVRADTRQRVLHVAKELDYIPHHAGRALRMSQASAFALIMPDINNAMFTEVLRGVEDGAAEADLIVLVGRSERMGPDGSLMRRLVRGGRIDGFLIQRRDEAVDGTSQDLGDQSMPTILINTHSRSSWGSVALDDAAAARAATTHLIELGHRNIAMVGGLRTRDTAVHREQGYRDAMRSAGLQVRREWTTDFGYTPDDGRRAAEHILRMPRRPTALVVANINAALGALHAARAMGVSIPEDLSVVAVHDAWTAEHTWPAITAVRMPQYELGLEGARALVRRMAGGPVEHIEITAPPPELVVRQSTAPPKAVPPTAVRRTSSRASHPKSVAEQA